MPIRKVYFVRHGETDYNASGLLQGSRIGVKADFLSYIQGIHAGPGDGTLGTSNLEPFGKV